MRADHVEVSREDAHASLCRVKAYSEAMVGADSKAGRKIQSDRVRELQAMITKVRFAEFRRHAAGGAVGGGRAQMTMKRWSELA